MQIITSRRLQDRNIFVKAKKRLPNKSLNNKQKCLYLMKHVRIRSTTVMVNIIDTRQISAAYQYLLLTVSSFSALQQLSLLPRYADPSFLATYRQADTQPIMYQIIFQVATRSQTTDCSSIGDDDCVVCPLKQTSSFCLSQQRSTGSSGIFHKINSLAKTD